MKTLKQNESLEKLRARVEKLEGKLKCTSQLMTGEANLKSLLEREGINTARLITFIEDAIDTERTVWWAANNDFMPKTDRKLAMIDARTLTLMLGAPITFK